MSESGNFYSCPRCRKRFSCKRYLTKHMQRGHKPKRIDDLACSMCSKRFLHLSHLQRHQLSHLNVREFECPHCSKAFVQKVHLDAHLKWTHRTAGDVDTLPSTSTGIVSQASFICKLCNTDFRSKWHLNRHKKRRHVSVECEVCKEVFDSLELVRAHEATHKSERPWPCKICFRRFSRSCELRIHEQTHSRMGTFLCVACNSVFIQRTQLTRHMKQVHLSQKNCDECDEKFTAMEQYTSHMQIIHSKVTCVYCGDDDHSREHIEMKHWKKLKIPVSVDSVCEAEGKSNQLLVKIEDGQN